MLIKIRENSLDIVKTSLTAYEDNYIEFMKHPENLERTETTNNITLTGNKESLFNVIYYIAKSCDVEIM